MQKIIIVGAGILGASTAFHLAKAGLNVVLIDRFDKGQATDAAAGIVCPWISQRRNKAWYEMVKGGARYYPDLIQQLKECGETETGYSRVGALSIHNDHTKLEKMAERAIERRKDAPEIGEVKILTPQQTKDLFPPLSDEFGSVWVSGAAKVNGRALRDALINAAVKCDAEVIHGDAELLQKGNSISGVRMDGREMQADKVIVTAGAWAKELLDQVGITFMVKPQKAQIVHLQIEDKGTEDWPVIMPQNDQYILSFEDGRVVIGATHENEVGFDSRVTAGGIHEVVSKALDIAPGLAQGEWLETRVGFRPFTPDFLPVIGPLPRVDGLLIANGLGASGLTSGPYLGAELAKLVQGIPTELDLTRYDPAGALQPKE
ncbi:NAD(P)/FAD-dependent oxidoreductase [Falsibacillus pallidus]|uniref:D-amino acid dehydrogenase small subunit n=1 Tax=Falsibacillus pallidus TaxID=493781 RepID=A0A370G3Y9_9BACI|nr:FAD-binding oxidoreductase [Falsibacillus pallidus]RDI38498.1 D-amino acid dehydrogenase small subunit [Falsibacillus pallidus]